MYASKDNVVNFASVAGKVPPQCIDAEMAVLGGILLDPEAIYRVRDFLKPEHFYVQSNARVYEACLKLNSNQKPTDLLSITNYLSSAGLLEVVGGRNGLAALIESTVSAVNIDALANIVIEKHKRRLLQRLGNLAQELAHKSEEDISIENACCELQEFIQGIQDNTITSGARHISEYLVQVDEQVQLAATGAKLPGEATGFYDLDTKMNGGVEPGELIIVAGRPAMGKSAFAAQIGFDMASRNIPTAMFSLEMSGTQVAMRALSGESWIENNYLKTGRVSNAQWSDYAEGMGKLNERTIYIDESACASVSYIEAQCYKINTQLQRQQKPNLGLVIVDYLQLMGDDNSKGNRHEVINGLARDLKRLAKKLNIAVICLSQLSRAVEARGNRRPMLSDLMESSGIEQNADKVLMLYRDEYYNPSTTERGLAEVILAKHRNGPTGTIKLLFDGQFTRFKNLARGSW